MILWCCLEHYSRHTTVTIFHETTDELLPLCLYTYVSNSKRSCVKPCSNNNFFWDTLEEVFLKVVWVGVVKLSSSSSLLKFLNSTPKVSIQKQKEQS